MHIHSNMTKKSKIIAFVVLLIAGITAGVFVFLNKSMNCQKLDYSGGGAPDIDILKSEVHQNNEEEIGRKIMEKYLCNAGGLSDYTIDKVTYNGINDGVLSFEVTFSVKPTDSSNSEWIAGNGERESDGWIRNKFLFVTVLEAKDSYLFGGASTGP
jgi:hypothetical protein